MRAVIGTAVVLATLALATSASVISAAAAPPVATPSPGYDARLSESHQQVQQRALHQDKAPKPKRRFHPARRTPFIPQVYGGPSYERSYDDQPYYYPYVAPVIVAPVIVPLYGYGFEFGW